MQLSNSNAATGTYTSFYSVHNGSSQVKMLTENALFLNTAGTITGGDDAAAIYLSKNANGGTDADNDWRMRVLSDKFVIEQYDSTGTSWEVKFEVS